MVSTSFANEQYRKQQRISHRLYLFPELDRVIWLENGEAKVGTHEELVGNTPDYAAQFDAQREENSHE